MSKEELIEQKKQLEKVLEYINKCLILIEKQDKLNKAIDKVDDRNDVKLQMLKFDLSNILNKGEE